MITRSLIVLATTVALSFGNVTAQNTKFGEITTLEQFGGSSIGEYNPSNEERQRIAWWRDAKFGMFIHWGLYSQIAGYWKNMKVKGGEWCLKMHKLPIEEYRNLANYFNPTSFDADEWVEIAKSAGMKYMVITSKHHDGFAMYHSDVSEYNIVDATPFKRDPIKELAEACRKQGIKFGLYYSHAQDWNEPDAYGNNWSWPGYKRDFNKYLKEKSIPQIKEILIKYDPDIIWFDTAGDITEEHAYKIAEICRSICPDILINSRIMLGKPKGLPLSDYNSGGDNEAFLEYNNVPWELCGTLNKSWAFKQWDTDFRPVKELLYHLIDAVSKNGNYLLNVGPTCEGVITEPYTNRLEKIGEWLAVNGEAIYSCSGTVWGTEFGEYKQVNGKRKLIVSPENWRCTSKGDTVYIHILNRPEDGKLTLPPLPGKVLRTCILGFAKERIKMRQNTKNIYLALPDLGTDIPFVVKLVLDKKDTIK